MKLLRLRLLLAAVAVVVTPAARSKGILDELLESRGLLRGSGGGGMMSDPGGVLGGDDGPPGGDGGPAAPVGDDPPEGGFPRGAKVMIHGMRSAVELNGKTATVIAFDNNKQRYALDLGGGMQKEIKPEDLSPAEAANEEETPKTPKRLGPMGFLFGSTVRISGLTSAAGAQLNGQEGVVRAFDDKAQRYVLEMPSGKPKAVKANHLAIVGSDSAPAASSGQEASTGSSGGGGAAGNGGGGGGNEAQDRWPAGTPVRVTGLVSAPKLNGAVAVVEGFDTSTGRYVVQMPDGTPKKIKQSHLIMLTGAGGSVADSPGPAVQPPSMPADPSSQGDRWPTGTQVAISGLHALSQLNGQVGVIRSFDANTQRYIVLVPGGGPPKKIKPKNLKPVSKELSSVSSAPNPPPSAVPAVAQVEVPPAGPWTNGTRVEVFGLKSAAQLNGQVAIVRAFDEKTKRYVVELPDGTPKKVKPTHLKLIDTVPTAPAKPAVSPNAVRHREIGLGAASVVIDKHSAQLVSMPQPRAQAKVVPTAAAVVTPAPVVTTAAPSVPRVAVCNAYPFQSPMQAFLISPDGENYMEIVTNLPYQGCMDVDIPADGATATIEFIVDKLQVARQSLNKTALAKNPSSTLVLVVYRSNPNTLKAAVLANAVMPRKDVYTLLVFNAYRGAELFELRSSREGVVQDLKLNKAYRLNREQALSLTMTNGFHQLNIGFQPRKGRIYAAICTGVEAGLRGQPRNLGFVVHEVGDFTASEEMADDKPPSAPTAPPVVALQQDDPPDEDAHAKSAAPWGGAMSAAMGLLVVVLATL